MQLTCVNHIQSLFTDRLESRRDLSNKWFHSFGTAPVAGEVEVKAFAHKPIGHTRKTQQRILDSVAKQFSAQQAIVDRYAERKLQTRFAATPPEFHVVLPAGKEKFPLQIRHLDQFGAQLLFHSGVFEGNKKRRYK